MTLSWQNLAALVVVATACLYLTRLAWMSLARKKDGACGGCGTCAGDAGTTGKQVFEIGSPGKRPGG